jgi:hypothetical protein
MGVKLGLSHTEEHRLRVFENRVLGRIFGRKSDEVTGGGGDYIRRCFVISTLHQLLFGWSNKEQNGRGM